MTLSFLRCKNSFNEHDDNETFDDMKMLGVVASTIFTARDDVVTIFEHLILYLISYKNPNYIISISNLDFDVKN